MTVLMACLALGLGHPGATCDRGGQALPLPRGGHATALLPIDVGREVARQHGWVGAAWLCMAELGRRESGWTVVKWNRAGSGAYGIGQALPASKMARYGRDYMTSAWTQVRWMVAYVAGRYGDPCSALAYHNRNGYY